jgi:hypothetical protein
MYGIKLKEVILKMSSSIDSHSRAIVSLTVEHKIDPNSSGEGDYTIEPEEAYALGNLVIQASKSKMPISRKFNLLHTYIMSNKRASIILTS